MALPYSSKRRRLLMGLAAVLPVAQFLRPLPAWAAQSDDTFLRISRIITGTDSISADVAARIHDLLAARNDKFVSELSDLSSAMQQAGGSRAEMLSRLTDAQVKFALSIAKPWYLGYVGTPSDFVMKDDAAFATFLEAQSYQKIIDFVPRPTYPRGNPGSWAVAPKGVVSPAMPEQIKEWTFHPGGPSAIMAPDPQWKTYATTKYDSLEEARNKKPGGANSPLHG